MREMRFGYSHRLTATVLTAAILAVGAGRAQAADLWNYYIHQSAPQFATSRGAQMLADEVQKLSGSDLRGTMPAGVG